MIEYPVETLWGSYSVSTEMHCGVDLWQVCEEEEEKEEREEEEIRSLLLVLQSQRSQAAPHR